MAAIIGHWRLRGYGLWVVAPKETGGFVGWAGCWNPEGFPEPRKFFEGTGLTPEELRLIERENAVVLMVLDA